MIDLSVRRPVATAAVYVALLALGVWSVWLIPLELLPEVEAPRLTVHATWRGASPESMEALVTAPLEGAAQRVDGVRSVASVSRADERGLGARSEITVRFAPDTRMEFARLELRERIAALRDELPPGAGPVSVEPYVPDEFQEESRPFMSWRLRGPYSFARLGEVAARELRPRLMAVEGVSAVRVVGDRRREVSVVVDPEALEIHDLTLADVRSRLDDLSELRAPGAVHLAGRRTVLAVRTRAESVEEVRALDVTPAAGTRVRLGDVARVAAVTSEPTGYFRIDGQPAVSIHAYRQSGTNAVELADRLRARMEALGGRLPTGVAVELDHDGSREIRAQLADLRLRALASAAVILLVLALFLRSVGSVLVVFASIAFSVLAAVHLLHLGGFTLNTLTLAGLAWGFGLVVDNSIVVLENVRRRQERGEPPPVAAREGARQVALPVVAATCTTAAVLVPFLMLQGELRAWYVPLGWAVGFSILASLLVAFTLVPSAAARLGGGRAGKGAAKSGSVGVDVSLADGVDRPTRSGDPGTDEAQPKAESPLYVRASRTLLGVALDHPVVVLLVCLVSLGGSWWLFDRHVTRGVAWADVWGQETYINIQITYPRGSGLERTDRLARSFEEKLATLPEVERFETRVQPSFARIRVTFPPELETTAVPVAAKEQMVAYSHGFTGPEVRVYGYGPSFYGGGGSPPNYAVEVYGYNYLTLQEIGQSLAGSLEGMTRIRDVDPNAAGRWYENDRASEYVVRPDRAALEDRDLSVEGLLDHVSAAVVGETGGGRIYLGGEELPLALKLEGYRDLGVRELRRLRVPTAGGGAARVEDVAAVERRDVLSRIRREDQEYRRTVAWEFRGPRKLGDIVRDATLGTLELPPGYRVEVEDPARWSEEERSQVGWAVAAAAGLLFLVTAVVFESLAAPFVVLLTLPLALIGVFVVFFYTGATFTRTAYIGAIMMAGIVVNNAILVVYHIGELRERVPTREAILRGTLERVRPILMTTLTTVLGLLPLILFAGNQDENVWNALVLATVGGLLSSTVFVLTALPVAYRWIVARGEFGRGTVQGIP